MPQLAEISIYLRGLWMLVSGNPQGLRLLDLSDRGMMRSFWAIVWCLPAMIVSWIWLHMVFSNAMAPSWHAGAGFFARLLLIELITWMVPLVLVATVLAFGGQGRKLPAVVTVVNWLAVPFSWAFGFLVLAMMLVPGARSMIALAWLVLLFSLITCLSVALRALLRGQTLVLAAVILTLIVPGLFLPEMLQRFLGIYPG